MNVEFSHRRRTVLITYEIFCVVLFQTWTARCLMKYLATVAVYNPGYVTYKHMSCCDSFANITSVVHWL